MNSFFFQKQTNIETLTNTAQTINLTIIVSIKESKFIFMQINVVIDAITQTNNKNMNSNPIYSFELLQNNIENKL